MSAEFATLDESHVNQAMKCDSLLTKITMKNWDRVLVRTDSISS